LASLKSEHVQQAIMVSNGMSVRRRTLKRPIVCRSKPDGNCGDCSLEWELIPDVMTGGQTVEVQIQLVCVDNPLDLNFTLFMEGPFLLVPINPLITANVVNLFHAIAPLQAGTYEPTIYAINSQHCQYKDSRTVIVN